MTKTVIHFVLLAIVLVLVQVVFNKIILLGVAVPIVFIYLILRLPVNLATNWVLTIGFVLGLVVDIFGNTPGMNALSCTVLAALRYPVFNIYMPRVNDMNTPIPSVDSMGVGIYFKYMSTLVFIYCLLLFMIQAFTLHSVMLTLARVGASSVLSIVIILGLDSLVSTRREKRL